MTVQSIAAVISFIGIAGMALVFLFVLARSTRERDYADVQPRAYAIRKRFFYVLLAGFFLVPALTLRELPYSPDRSRAEIVEVSAHQWYWVLSETDFKTNHPIIFRVVSEDVNHGFGIYDDANRLIAQVQAMPGYVNEIAIEFERPGSYKVMCLEYCGLVHHSMLAALEVTSETASRENL